MPSTVADHPPVVRPPDPPPSLPVQPVRRWHVVHPDVPISDVGMLALLTGATGVC